MTIQDLGSIGEIVGAAATVLTLLYLAIQIRANTRMMSAQSSHARYQLSSTINTALAQDQQLAGVFRRGLENFELLEPDERTQFMFAMGQIVGVTQLAHSDLASGVNDQASFDITWNSSRHLLASPGGKAFWQMMGRHAYSREFAAFVDGELSSVRAGQRSSDT